MRFCLPIVLSLSVAAPACAADRPKGVVELFTSQGCSSCPPADRILGELARDPSLIALSLPVDYWDYIGWKDTLATPATTARQKDYAATRGDGQVYTPQAVIDGVTHVVGSDRDAIGAALAEHAGALAVEVEAKRANGRIAVDAGAGPERRGGVWLVEAQPQATVAVGRGENAGRTLVYVNVVRRMTRLGDWNGAAVHFETTVAGDGGEFFALVQAGAANRPGAILGAARAR